MSENTGAELSASSQVSAESSADGEKTNAIERLRKSRELFNQDLRIDAKKAGCAWLHHEASYEQVLLIERFYEDSDFPGAPDSEVFKALFSDIDRTVDTLSGVASWKRGDIWLSAFIEAAVLRWREISAEVEGDG